jgi:hypothetical protein
MSFQNLQINRVVQAVIITFVLGIVFSFSAQFVYALVRVVDVVSELDSNATLEEQQDQLQGEMDRIIEESTNPSSALNSLSMVAWALTAGATYIMARRTARKHAESPPQAVGYGAAIGLGVFIAYGLCICSASVAFPLQLLFLILIIAGGVFGGQSASTSLGQPQPAPRRDVPRAPSAFPTSPEQIAAPTPGGNPETYYNMGVMAALGGRRDEARQHFTRVLQMQPRHVPAWLQLANLADTPEQAWGYVQQARAISPHDPAVLEAVSVIEPKLAARADQAPPRAQPPYLGAPEDDTDIPRGALPSAGPGEPPDEDGEPSPPTV